MTAHLARTAGATTAGPTTAGPTIARATTDGTGPPAGAAPGTQGLA